MTPRLLFILSHDFGELATALHFLDRQPFDALLCLPPRLAAANPDLPYPTRTYTHPDDLFTAIDTHRPHAALLFSAYLYAINQLLPADALHSLLHHLKNQRIPFVTTDPFLGLLSTPAPAPFHDQHPLKSQLATHFLPASRLLQEVPHLYVTDPRDVTVPHKLAFHNPAIELKAGDRQRLLAALSAELGIPDKPLWLFLLSSEDFAAQVNRHGRKTFLDQLHHLLDDANANGAYPILLAPQSCVEAVTPRATATLMTFCPHALFRQLLHAAEYAFYWNIVSNSLLLRVLNELPVFFFDEGHLLSALPPLRGRVMRTYFPDATLLFLLPNQPLDPQHLKQLSQNQPHAFTTTRSRIRALPSPTQLVDQLIAGGGHAP